QKADGQQHGDYSCHVYFRHLRSPQCVLKSERTTVLSADEPADDRAQVEGSATPRASGIPLRANHFGSLRPGRTGALCKFDSAAVAATQALASAFPRIPPTCSASAQSHYS